MNNFDQWFSEFKKTNDYQILSKNPVVYFCAEYALTSEIQSYAGGLGILAGDLLKEAGKQDLPFVAIGLYYREGYTQEESEHWNRSRISPEEAGLKPVLDKNKQNLLVSVPISDKTIYARVWLWKEKNASLYLLDTETPENEKREDRDITNRLYTTNKEIRIKQEMLLGIGGIRLLKRLEIQPSIYHLNEGYPAFAIFELIKEEMDNNKSDFSKACEQIRQKIIYTNHTLISGGHHTFSADLVSIVISDYSKEFKISVTDLLSLGLIPDSSLFSPTMLCLRLSGKMNTVSDLHNEEAKKIWRDREIETVTNGIFLPFWDKINSDNENDFFPKHQENKRKLLAVIKEKTKENWSENELLIGWARRIVAYKRPLAILENLEEFKKLATNSGRPIKIVFAGISHENDAEAANLLNKLQSIVQNELKTTAVFLKNYNIELAELLIAGCDIWLNTPIVKSEACGTSGMKAALNCVLPLTTRDGWVNEARLQKVGWTAHDPNLSADLIRLLENEIAPLYYQHLNIPIGSDWVKRMVEARKMIINNFSATRVLKDYMEKMYLPIITNLQ